MSLDAQLQRLWYGSAWRSLPLWPLSALFRAGVAFRNATYRSGLLQAEAVAAPVIVVGNLTVGGTGKTPVAAWLAKQLELRGHRVGVVLRGYGGSYAGRPRVVVDADDAAIVGDEALLHARRRTHVVVIGVDRVAAAKLAIEHGAEVIVSDDGLQHVRLARDYEIAVIDAARGLGNGLLLPAGPLREPAQRLERVDALVLVERPGIAAVDPRLRPRKPFVVHAQFALGEAVSLRTGERRRLEAFAGSPVHAVAGIGNPQSFFAALRAAGLLCVEHALRDHARLDAAALGLPAGATVLMTEKDAVKCSPGTLDDGWWIDLEVSIDRATAGQWLSLILERIGRTGAGVHLG